VSPEETVSFRGRELKGSRLRCLMLTSLAERQVAASLSRLIEPHGLVTTQDSWQPRGFLEAGEAQLGSAEAFLTPEQREAVSSWWLAVRQNANTPNWDLVATAQFDGQRGLILVEAKAHAGELGAAGKPPGNERNDAQIRAAIKEANDALGGALQGWHLSAESHYQLCNRFAWAWKVASLGIPVALVYLGFLDADEMGDGAFTSASAWQSCLLTHGDGVVPRDAWGQKIPAGASWFVPLIRSVRLSADVEAPH